MCTVEASTFNGVRIVVRVGPADPDHELRLQASYEPDHDRGAASEGGSDGEQLARSLNKRWRGRAFSVPRYALDSLLVRRADLIQATEAPAAE